VRIEQKAVAVSHNEDAIQTWYKAQIVDNLTAFPLPSKDAVQENDTVPVPLLPLSEDSIVIKNAGGQIRHEVRRLV
jgi:hypothetical protein